MNFLGVLSARGEASATMSVCAVIQPSTLPPLCPNDSNYSENCAGRSRSLSTTQWVALKNGLGLGDLKAER